MLSAELLEKTKLTLSQYSTTSSTDKTSTALCFWAFDDARTVPTPASGGDEDIEDDDAIAKNFKHIAASRKRTKRVSVVLADTVFQSASIVFQSWPLSIFDGWNEES